MQLNRLTFTLIATLSLLAAYWFQSDKPVVDEVYHMPQIEAFATGSDERLPQITTFVYLHQAYAQLAQLGGIIDPMQYRLASVLLGLVLALTLLKLAHRNGAFDGVLAAQVFFIPIIFPYASLVYTDIPALVALLWALYFHHLQKHWPAALMLGLAVLVRQPSLVWLGLFVLLTVVLQTGLNPRSIDRKSFIKGLQHSVPYWLVFGLSVWFFASNQGIAMGDKQMHNISFNPTNVYFLVLVFAWMFLPMIISQGQRVLSLLQKHSWLWAVILVCLPVYVLSFEVNHPYNSEALNVFIRNWVLNHINQSLALKVMTYLISVYALLAMITIDFKSKEWRVFWLFIPLTVVLMPLIEQRYYMASAVFWLLQRNPINRTVEWVQLLWTLTMAWIIYWGVANHWFYF